MHIEEKRLGSFHMSCETRRKIGILGRDIRLDQFLKWAGITATGGQAKALIQDGYVTVNASTEFRRGHRLHPGDVVRIKGIQGEEYEVVRGGLHDT